MSWRDFFLKNKGIKQRVFKNTFWLFLGQAIGRSLRAILIIYAARMLGATDWGIFSYAISIVSFLGIFTDLGINAVLTKETVRLNPESAQKRRSEIVSTSFFLKLLMIFFSLMVLIFIAPYFSNIKEATALFPIMALILVFDNLREFGFSITRALEQMEVEAIFFIITNLLIVAAGFLFLYIKASPASLAYSYVFGTAVGMVVTFLYLQEHFVELWKNFSRKLVGPIFGAAWPFAMLSIMGSLMINTDMILLGWFRPAKELGLYAAAQKPIQALYVLPSLVATSLFPTLSRLAHADNERAAEVIKKTLRLILMLVVPGVLAGIILGPEIINLIFGSEYLPTTLNWQILILSTIFVFPGTIIGNAIFAYDKQKLFIKVLAVGVLSNIILDLAFIPRWGGPGSAVATIIAQLLINLFLWTSLKRINRSVKDFFLKNILIAAVLMGLALWIMKILGINFIINTLVASLLYLLILIFLKEPLLFWLR